MSDPVPDDSAPARPSHAGRYALIVLAIALLVAVW